MNDDTQLTDTSPDDLTLSQQVRLRVIAINAAVRAGASQDNGGSWAGEQLVAAAKRVETYLRRGK